MNKATLGTYIWGTATVLLALIALVIVVWAGWNIVGVCPDKSYQFAPNTPQQVKGLFYALRENGNLVAGILGFSGLAWSHFYQTPHLASRSKQPCEVEDEQD